MIFISTIKTAIKNLKPGKFCVIDGVPCKVNSVTCSVSGKHGGAKARLDATGLWDGRRRSVVKPADTEIDVPIIDKRNGQAIAITGNTAQIMDLETYETFESEIPEELEGKVTQGCEIHYWVIMGRKMLVSVK